MTRCEDIPSALQDLELEPLHVYLHKAHFCQLEFVCYRVECPDGHFFDSYLLYACVRKERVCPLPAPQVELGRAGRAANGDVEELGVRIVVRIHVQGEQPKVLRGRLERDHPPFGTNFLGRLQREAANVRSHVKDDVSGLDLRLLLIDVLVEDLLERGGVPVEGRPQVDDAASRQFRLEYGKDYPA